MKFVATIKSLIRQWNGSGDFLVIKDPRITILFDFWSEAAELEGFAIKTVITVRHPAEVAASLADRNQMTPELSRLLWLKYYLFAERFSRNFPRTFVEYSALINNWRSQTSRVSPAISIDFAKADEAAIDDFLSSDLYHHRHRKADEATKYSGGLPIAQFYSMMSAAANDAPLNMHTLDDIFEQCRGCERTMRIGHSDFQQRFSPMCVGRPAKTSDSEIRKSPNAYLSRIISTLRRNGASLRG